MKSTLTTQLQGTLHELKGAVKKKAGQLTDNPRMQAEGEAEQFAGKVEKKIGQIEKVIVK